jgi:subtilase family serine protease
MAHCTSTRTTGRPHRRRFYHWRLCRFEPLELRQLLSASVDPQSGLAYPLYEFVPSSPSAKPVGYAPTQMQTAYGINLISFTHRNANGTTTTYSEQNQNLGAGETIAIVDAFNDPNIVSDLATFDAAFNLPAPPSFKIVNQNGSSVLPVADAGWAVEIALDVEWAHAIAPGANILLVEATNNSDANLDAAVNYARNYPGVVVVSNSYGGTEFFTDPSQDFYFTTPSGHAGVSFTVSAGDNGGPALYPSASPNVLSVGGTSLTLNTITNAYIGETVWKDTTGSIHGAGGGGQSGFLVVDPFTGALSLTPLEPVPNYQSGLGLTSRGTPDVSYNADVRTGVAEYDSYGIGGWISQGGTSAGAPQWAALIAIADQGRALMGKPSLSNVQSIIYKLPASDFHDIKTGDNDLLGLGLGLTGNAAGPGYDLASGRGAPIANLVIRDLVAFNGSTFVSPISRPFSGNSTGIWYFFAKTGKKSAMTGDGSGSGYGAAAISFATAVDDGGLISTDNLAADEFLPADSDRGPGAVQAGSLCSEYTEVELASDAQDDGSYLSQHFHRVHGTDADSSNAALDGFFALI